MILWWWSRHLAQTQNQGQSQVVGHRHALTSIIKLLNCLLSEVTDVKEGITSFLVRRQFCYCGSSCNFRFFSDVAAGVLSLMWYGQVRSDIWKLSDTKTDATNFWCLWLFAWSCSTYLLKFVAHKMGHNFMVVYILHLLHLVHIYDSVLQDNNAC